MIDDLLKATKEGRWPEATELLYRHWVSSSQTVYPSTLERPWEGAVDDAKIANELLYPLAAMFCAESAPSSPQEEPRLDVSLRKLKETVQIDEEKARAGQICGRMFKNGEPNYSCKECATDSTCVLCYECFVNSAHMNHKYKMHTSLGSGYCDCGDPEAWTNDYACKLHKPRAKEADEMETDGTGLPPQIANRLHHLSLITLKFAVNLLCWDPSEQFPAIIDSSSIAPERETFQTILFNDETHTYEGVIRALELAITCNTAQAMRIATIVDREGRAIVRTGSRDICEHVKTTIENRTKKESNRRTQKTGPLVVKVFRSTLSALQSLAVRLLGWLSAQAQEFPPLGPILSESLLYGCPNCDCVAPLGRARQGELHRLCNCETGSNVVLLMLFDRRLWKSARTAFHQLLMSSVLMDLEHKYIFGRLLVQNYNIIFDDFIDDDHEHSVSVTSMTVQIFTVPTIARRLIIEEDALHVCMESLRKFCKKYVITASPHHNQLFRMDFTNDSYPAVLKRALYMLNDVGYLLTLIPKETSEWTDGLRTKFVHGTGTLLRYLGYMDGMDVVKRQAVEHLLMESEWETAFNIFLRLQEPISLILSWARTDPVVHSQLFRLALHLIRIRTNYMEEFKSSVYVEVNGTSANCIPFEVSRKPISVHHPLWRFIGGLFCAPDSILANYTSDPDKGKNILDMLTPIAIVSLELEEPMNLRDVCAMLMEMPLRVLVLNAQAGAAQLWRRNGFSLVNQIHNYSSNLCRTEMYDRDIQLLQAIGALIDPNQFLIRLIDRFGLAKWAKCGFEDLPSNYSMEGTPTEESSKIFTVIAEEMVHLLIILLGERYTIGLSDEATAQKALEREILHILCTGPKPFSYIEKYVPNDPAIQRLSLETAVRNVADFKRPTTVTSGQFHLKEHLRAEFNPFFWHYSKHMSSLAEQQQNKERAQLARELKACPPPIPPQFARFFAPLLRIMESKVFIKLIRVIVERISKRSRFVSDGLFYRALYLLGMSLNEQKRAHDEGREFDFLKMVKAEGIFDMLERLLDKPEVETHNDLLWFVLKTYKEVAALYSKEEPMETQQKEPAPKEKETSGAQQKAAMAARKRQLALERMRQLQNSFKTQNISLLDDNTAAEQEGQGDAMTLDDNEPASLPPDAGFPVCCGLGKSIVQLRPQPVVMCILCQEDESISFDGNPIVCSAFVQSSRLFSQKCTNMSAEMDEPNEDALNIFSPINLEQELHVSTCSHLMHFSCYNTFIDSVNARERNRYRPNLLNSRSLNSESGEYLCPLCKRLSNCVLPVYPPVQTLRKLKNFHEPKERLQEVKGFSEDRPAQFQQESFDAWVAALSTLVTQPISPIKPGHSRKRSHSERSLLDLAKTASSTQSTPIGIEADTLSTAVGLSTSSLASSLPSFLAPPIDPDAEAEQEGGQTDRTQRLSMSTISSASHDSNAAIWENIGRQIQAVEQSQTRNVAYMQHALGYLFRTKNKAKGIHEINIPNSIPHWATLKPLLTTLEKTRTLEKLDRQYYSPLENLTHFLRYELQNVLKACSFLVRSVASVLETENKPLFGAYNTRQRDCLNAFIRISQLIPFNCQPSGIRVLVSRLLSPLLAPPFEDGSTISATEPGSSKATMSSQMDRVPRSEAGIMEIDMLTLAVELIFCIGWTWSDGRRLLHNSIGIDLVHKVADGSLDELYVIRLTLLAHLYQVIALELDKEESDETDQSAPTELPPDFDAVMARLKEQHPFGYWIVGPKVKVGGMVRLYNRLHSAAIAFLRPLAILYNVITLVPPPESLKDPSLDNFIPLCRYLGLPTSLLELLSGPEVERLFAMWSRHKFPLEIRHELLELPLKLNKLIDLPTDFSQLINMAVNFKCPQVDEMTSTIPTLCLICGEMLCSQSYCCQKMVNNKNVGSCTYHLAHCHNSTGVFFRIRECQIIFLYVAGNFSRGCFKPAPYVDEFGETDPGFRRGNPMHLNKELYWKIQRQWIHQEIAEEVINQYELNHRNIAFEWEHF